MAHPKLRRRPSARMITPFHLEDETINLGLDVDALACLFNTSHINLIIEVTNVSNDGVVLHLAHCIGHEDSLLPVVVMKISAISTTSSRVVTVKPSIQA